MRASFWRPLSRRGFVGTGSYPAPSRTLSGGLFSTPFSIAASGWPPLRATATSRLPLRQIRRDRRRVRATDNRRPVRLPSVRSELCSPGGLGPACCSRAQPCPAPCRLPRSLPASSKAGGPFQTIPCSRCLAAARALRPRRLLEERCVSPTSATDSTKRAPSGPFDSRLRSRFHQACACRRQACARTCEITDSSWANGLTNPGVGTPEPLTGRATEWSFA